MSDSDHFDLQAVIDAGSVGPEPSEDYLSALDMLDNVTRECIYVSKKYGDIASPTGAHFYASVLFVAMISRTISLLNLAPHSPWSIKKIEHWDYASMTGIVRTMIEIRATFYYLCYEECSTEEWSCRWNLFNLHDCVSRIRMFEAQGNDMQVKGLQVQADELRDRLKGQTAYLFPLENLVEKAGMSIDAFRWLYIFFSTHVHGLPMSFYRIGGDNPERGRGLPSETEEGYSSLCLTLAAGLIVAMRDEMHLMFDGLTKLSADPVDNSDKISPEFKLIEIGDTDVMDATEDIRITRKRETQELVTISYTYVPTNAVVFEGAFDTDDLLDFKMFDPYFWSISINNRPATHNDIASIEEGNFLIEIDHVGRKIAFKKPA
jgi:hypothetical protein